jgi:hypothetical protein
MSKTIYRLDLTKEELDSIKDKLDENLIKKIKEIEITDKKLSSMSKALSLKVEIAKAKFMEAYLDLGEEGIEQTQYNLRKYKKIPYQTSKKYLDMLALAQTDTEIGIGYEPDEYISTRTIEDVELEMEYNKYLVEKYSKKKK